MYRASLQRKNTEQITTTKKLFELAKKIFKKIKFDICTVQEFDDNKQKLESRFAKAKPIKNTRQYHCYEPLGDNKMECKILSKHLENTILKM